ncbi:MAG: tRNA (adenosine(37)-N6)-dimethylallyltransferase MiaA [Bacteroidota bacterium]
MSLNEDKIIVITGPTASGKTSLAVSLAGHMDIEVISADSRQIYRYLDIGTAKPTEEELSAVKHHFIDILDPDENYSAGRFGEEAYNSFIKIKETGKLPVVVGGSGLYIKALCEGLFDESGPPCPEIRKMLEERLANEGIDAMYTELEGIDPKSAILFEDKNPRRILRALEYYIINNEPISEAHESSRRKRNLKPLYIGLNFERDDLYERINLRVDKMWQEGIIGETKRVLEMGYSPALNSLNTVGYKEVISRLKNEISEEEALRLIKRNTRRYAKRQLTWFRKYADMNWLPPEMKKAENAALKLIKDFN